MLPADDSGGGGSVCFEAELSRRLLLAALTSLSRLRRCRIVVRNGGNANSSFTALLLRVLCAEPRRDKASAALDGAAAVCKAGCLGTATDAWEDGRLAP